MNLQAWTAILASGMLLGAMALKLWSALSLIQRYRVDEYVADATARTLYIASIASSAVMLTAIVLLSILTRTWWVELFVGLFATSFGAKLVWAVWMRLSGRWRSYYAARGYAPESPS